MSTKYKINNPEGIFFLSFAVVEWVDVFTSPIYKDIFVESLKYCQENKGLTIHSPDKNIGNQKHTLGDFYGYYIDETTSGDSIQLVSSGLH